MSSPSPNRLKQTFSKGPAHNTRSSTARTRTSKSAPTVPPDPGETNNPHSSTPSNRPSSTSFIQPSTSFNNPSPSPSSSNIQQSSSPSTNIAFHSSPPTSSPFKSSPTNHSNSNNRFSALEEPSTSDQLDKMDEHIHHVENNMLTMAKDIGNHTDIISKLATAINHISTMIEKIVPKDEIDNDIDNKNDISLQSQQPSHSHSTKPSNNYEVDHDLSFESEPDTLKQNFTTPSYAQVVNSPRKDISQDVTYNNQRTNSTSSNPVHSKLNAVSSNTVDEVRTTNSVHSNHIPILPSQTKSEYPTAFKPYSTSHTPKISPRFNSNQFFSILESTKLKYTSMESYLAKQKLTNDSYQALEQFYSAVLRAINMGFSAQLYFLPTFIQLRQTTSFKSLFLDGLFDHNYDKAFTIFTSIGQFLKDRLLHSECIDKVTAPKSYILISSYPTIDGWSLFENLLKKRLVHCGALPQNDLDTIRAGIVFQNEESIHAFLHRIQQLENEYVLQLSLQPQLVPYTKLVKRFITELMRAQEYQPYLLSFEREIIQHIKQHGEHNLTHKAPFTIMEIYESITTYSIPAIPSKLLPSRNLINTPPITSLPITTPNVQSVIASGIVTDKVDNDETDNVNKEFALEEWYTESTNEPIIGAIQKKSDNNNRNKGPRPFCQCCMTPGHTSDHCFLRGQAFRPELLNKRINVFNQQHGDKPPPGTEIKTWNPRSPPPILNNNKSSTKPTIKFGHMETTKTNPSISSFIQQQNHVANLCLHTNNDDSLSDDDDDIDILLGLMQSQLPTITSCSNSDITLTSDHHDICFPFSSTTHIASSTPSDILKQMKNVHHNKQNPSIKFIQQFTTELNRLPNDSFTDFAKLYLQIDTGANVHAVTSPHLLVYFIKQSTKVRNINGESFVSPGWGSSIIHINEQHYMISPVFLCPSNPHNTLSLGALKLYSKFQKAIIDTHDHIELHDHQGVEHQIPVTTTNGLDYVQLQFASFKPTAMSLRPIQQNINNQENKEVNNTNEISVTPGINNLFCQSPRDKFIFPMNVMANISAYYVNLFTSVSPRNQAILTMNQLLNAKYAPPILNSCEHIMNNYIPITPNNSLSLSSNETITIPIIGKLFRSIPASKRPPIQTYMLLHLLMQHASKSSIMKMFKMKTFENMPDISKMHDIECSCEICNITKATKVPKGKLVDVTKLTPFKRIHCDFSFFGVKSIRGFSSAFDVVCASTSYPLGFPSKSKGVPLVIFTWTVKTLRSMGYEVIFIRVDEDGALARSAEFCSAVIKLNCILETTGGGNSENNGKVERANRVKGDMIRSSLATAKRIFGKHLPTNMTIQSFWCFAYCHANYTHRRLYNRLRKNSPYFLVHHRRPTINDLCIFGSRITVIAPNKKQIGKLSEDRTIQGFFLSYGNHTSNILYWKPSDPEGYHRAHHAVIDEAGTFYDLDHIFHCPQDDNNTTESTTEVKHPTNDTIELEVKSTPFYNENDIRQVTMTLPTPGNRIGLQLQDDPLLNLPFIHDCIPNSFAWDSIPSTYRKNSLIIDINGESPITATFALQLIKTVQATNSRVLTIDLIKRDRHPTTTLEMSRAMFDQLPSLTVQRPNISAAFTLKDDFASHDHFITSPTKPSTPKSYFDCVKGPYRRAFQAAARIQFEKNRKVVVFSKPIPKSELPPDTRVFRTLLVPGFKDTDMPGVYECRIRDCTVGTPQVKGLDFPESYCATVDSTTYKLVFAISAMNGNTISVIDVKNAFQTSIAPPEFRIFVTVPPLYLNWLRDTEDFQFDEGTTYVRQMLNANQGTKSASHVWYWLLVPILKKYGFTRSTIDHAFFIRHCSKETYFYICLATDDLLCSHPNQDEFNKLVEYLNQYFELSVQQGNVIKILSLRIIQTEHAISIDQTTYILSLLQHYFGDDVDKIKTVTTPMRTDSEFEKEWHLATAISQNELSNYFKKYKGSYRFHIGKFGYCTQTRADIQFPYQRMAEKSVEPTDIAFTQISRCYRYLAGDPHRPIVYPRRPFSGTTTLSQFITPAQQIKLTIPNNLQVFADAELARNLSDRKSYYCIVIMINAVAIEFKMKKTTTIMTHTTDAETKAQFVAVRRLQPIRRLLESMGYPCPAPTNVYTDNSAVTAIVEANRMTPRCRHIDIPIAYLHQEHRKSFLNILIRTNQMIADLGTKPLAAILHRRFKYWITGEAFLPPKGTLHYELLEMDLYEQCFIEYAAIIAKRPSK
jgi:hypothetical protein